MQNFHQIYTDYPRLISDAQKQMGNDSYILMDQFANEKLRSYIAEHFPAEQILEISSINNFSVNILSGKSVIIIGTYLALMAIPYLDTDKLMVISSEETNLVLPSHIRSIYNNVEKKANLTMNILLNALNHNFDLNHDCKVY